MKSNFLSLHLRQRHQVFTVHCATQPVTIPSKLKELLPTCRHILPLGFSRR